MTKALVAYFSATGTTAALAKRIAQEAGADLFEIVPREPYTQSDLDWTDKHSRSSREMNDLSSRPAIELTLPTMDDYDTIYLGFPIWWYIAPTIINTFLETYDMTGKTIVPFATSGGSGMGRAVKSLEKSAPGAHFTAGAVLNHPTDWQIKDFIDQAQS